MDLFTCVLALLGLAILLIASIIQAIKTKKAAWIASAVIATALIVLLAVYTASTLLLVSAIG